MAIGQDFYVYLLRSSDLVPLYVGKGRVGRWKTSKKRFSKLLRDELSVEFIQQGLTEKEAFDLEKSTIDQYGRLALKTGTLLNSTVGGEGFVGVKHNEFTREYMRLTYKPPSQKGVKQAQETVEKRRASRAGYKHSDETVAKIAAGNKGKVISPEARAKMRAAKLGRKQSPEHAAKAAATRIGKKCSPETGAKISAAKMGKPRPDIAASKWWHTPEGGHYRAPVPRSEQDIPGRSAEVIAAIRVATIAEINRRKAGS